MMSDEKVKAFLERYNRANSQVQNYCRLVPAEMTEFNDADQWEDEDFVCFDDENMEKEFQEGVLISDMFHELTDVQKFQTGLKQLVCWMCEKILYPCGHETGGIGISLEVYEGGTDRVIKTLSGVQCMSCCVRYALDDGKILRLMDYNIGSDGNMA